MKFLLSGFLFIILALGMGIPSLKLSEAQAGEALKQPLSQTLLAKKRCEKCKRGPDGKMVCKEVPCPK